MLILAEGRDWTLLLRELDKCSSAGIHHLCPSLFHKSETPSQLSATAPTCRQIRVFSNIVVCGLPMPRLAFPWGAQDHWSHCWGQRDRAVHLLHCSLGRGRCLQISLRVANFDPLGRQLLLPRCPDPFPLPRWLQLTTRGLSLCWLCAEMLSGSVLELLALCRLARQEGQTSAPSQGLTFPVLQESCRASSYSRAAANPSSHQCQAVCNTLSSPVRPAQVL